MKLDDVRQILPGHGAARILGLALSFMFLGAACGSDAETTTVSCTIADTGNIEGTDSCTDYQGFPATTVMQLCTIPGAQYAASACPSVNRIGGCSGSLGTAKYTRWYYPRSDAATPATAADVMEDCSRVTPAETFTSP